MSTPIGRYDRLVGRPSISRKLTQSHVSESFNAFHDYKVLSTVANERQRHDINNYLRGAIERLKGLGKHIRLGTRDGERRATLGLSPSRERKHVDIQLLLQVQSEGASPNVA